MLNTESTPMEPVDPKALDQLFHDARTANTFSDEPVSADTLQAIYELTRMGPTMMNLQSLRITWVQSEDQRARLVAHAGGNNGGKAATAPAVAVLSWDSDWHENFPMFYPHAPERKELFDGDADSRALIARQNAWLAGGYFTLAVRAQGLAAGPMTGWDFAGVDADFNAGTTWNAFMVVNVGKPGVDAWFPRLPRLDEELAVKTV
ncbi:malonic semialdehyde reductase [Citricoccus sp. NPDC079358]|uniref:malonic semialdehyde reductase n=1 Tax=Citricoccus sp. NPDC079358 TaxID=3154653 RepID=UPI00344D5865